MEIWPKTVKGNLNRLVFVIMLPGIGLGIFGAWDASVAQREHVKEALRAQSRVLALEIDSEFMRNETWLRSVYSSAAIGRV